MYQSFKTRVWTIGEDEPSFSSMRFATEGEALESGNELMSRWTRVETIGVEGSTDSVNYQFVDGKNQRLEGD